ncbi:MAG: DinB family protein [Marivirga sp.]|nr:DinB family protein [Marivirga sp.]
MNSTNQAVPETALFTTTFLKAWTLQVKRINELLESLSNEDLLKEIAPGRNTGIYLLGHLTAVNDGILPLLGFCNKLYPDLEKVFISSPDKSGLSYPSIDELKESWNDVNEKLNQYFNSLAPEEWLTKHEAVSAEDFAKEPHRNKLNVLISRTTHMSYHLGQLIFLTGKE